MNAYGRLIQRVKKVDRIAALRLARELPLMAARGQLKRGHYGNGLTSSEEGRIEDTIIDTFVWDLTPEGHDYWYDINKKERKN